MDIIELARKIANDVKNGDYVAGHAIFLERDKYFGVTPEKIMTEGMKIQDASIGVSFTSRNFEPVFEECLLNLSDLAKNSLGAVVIIAIPGELIAGYDRCCFESLDSSSILLEPTDKLSDYCKDIYGRPTQVALLPTKYLAGYLDVNENLFIENPNYAFKNVCRQSNISALKTLFNNRYKKILLDFNKSKKQYAPIKILKKR